MTASGIQVRPIRMRDLVRMSTMRVDAVMPDQPRAPFGPRLVDPWSLLPVTRRAHKSFVAYLDDELAGLIDLIADPANHRWLLTRLLTSRQVAAELPQSRCEAVWRELALQAIRAAGAARAKRIHAVLDAESPVVPALVATGFSEYAQDTIMLARPLPRHEPAGVVRRQESSDVWAVHQLYHQVTPRPVQYAEALTSNYWSRIAPGQPASRSYVVEDGLEIVAHCRVISGCDGPMLHLMVQPGTLDLISPVVRDVLADIDRNYKGPIGLVVPDYLQEYSNPLESLGFEEFGRQSRLVKYTVVTRRSPVRGLEELANEVPERVAAGTPTLSYAPTGKSEESSRHTNGNQRQHGIS